MHQNNFFFNLFKNSNFTYSSLNTILCHLFKKTKSKYLKKLIFKKLENLLKKKQFKGEQIFAIMQLKNEIRFLKKLNKKKRTIIIKSLLKNELKRFEFVEKWDLKIKRNSIKKRNFFYKNDKERKN